MENQDATMWARIRRRAIEEPFVTAGALITCGVLASAIYHLRRGNKDAGNRMLRYRVIAQGCTVMALLGYGFLDYQKKRQKALEEQMQQAQSDAKDKPRFHWEE
ncbi:Respiratory supercomplex factor 1, mitochondrial [Dispira simplex]|nr:Respiratory supercomplex factor 1, mitochondrial [Dispira simplex]